MIDPQAFALAHLAIIVAAMVAFVVVDRRQRKRVVWRHRGTRYRALSTAEVMEMIRKAGRRS